MKKIRIVGAGFSGLASAYFLLKKGYSVEVFDRNDSVGGLVHTSRTSFGLMESAANGFMNSLLVEELFADLGLKLQGTKSSAKKRYIVIQKPSRLPLSIWEVFNLAIKLLWGIFKNGKNYFKPIPQESIFHWGQRCLGLPMTNKVLAPALQGIYSGDSTRLSASLIIGKYFHQATNSPEIKNKRKLKYRGTVAPEGGMGELMNAMREYLQSKGVQFRLGVEYSKFETGFEHVLAGSAHDAAKFLEPLAPEIARKLFKIDLLPIVSTTVFFERTTRQLQGFGCLFSRESQYRPLGVLFNDGIFAKRSEFRSETWICGGAQDRQILNVNDAEIIKILLGSRKELFHLLQKPLHYRIHRWPKAIPHYDLYLESILNEGLELPQEVHLIGNYLGVIGLGKILEKAEELAEKLAGQNL